MKPKIYCLVTLLLIQLVSFNLQAQSIPGDLAKWKPWVQYQQEFNACPYFFNANNQIPSSHVCAWPSSLTIAIKANKANFSLQWNVLQDSWVPLIGGYKSWPQRVMINNVFVAVQNNNSQPRIYLKKGNYTIKGQFDWVKRPQFIQIPNEIADVTMSIDDKYINFPVIKEKRLWLGENKHSSKIETNSTEIEVNRLIIDDHPMTMYASIMIDVSGAARTEKLGKISTEQLQVIGVSGELSAYLDKQGYLWAQLKPGSYEINVSFIVLNWPEHITFQAIGENWPKQEVWAYQDNKNIRITEIKGVEPINPEQADSIWDKVPNYLINSGDIFDIKESKRGTLNQTGQFFLNRTIWLGFDGKTYRSKDEITGSKLGSWRLNSQSGYKLLSAKSHNENMLITDSKDGRQGLELRTPNVNLVVNAEFGGEYLNRITPWENSFDNISTLVYLPYGYMALAANNVDSSQGLWLEKWKLWDIFIIMLLTVFCFKAINLKTALLALITLILGYHEFNMPLIAWINLVVIVAVLSHKVTGKLKILFRFYALMSVISLLVALVPFLITQVRLSLHPQLDNIFENYLSSSKYEKSVHPAPKKRAKKIENYSQTYNNMMVQQKVQTPGDFEERVLLEKLVTTGSRIRNIDLLNKYQSGSVLQAGKAIPQWKSNRIYLQWDGPIDQQQDYQLFILTPLMRAIWRLLLVITSVFWLLFLFKKYKGEKPKVKIEKAATSLVLTSLILISSVGFTQNYPTSDLLDEMHNRLYPQSECMKNCASLDFVRMNVENSKLVMNLDYHVFDDVLVPIPHSQNWRITKLSINSTQNDKRVNYRNSTWIRVKKGINHITITAQLAKQNNISVFFPLVPHSINAYAEGWQVAGIDEKVLKNNTLQLISTLEEIKTADKTNTTDIQAFVTVERYLTFDDDWTISTKITRVAPSKGVINLKIPLIAGEHPTDNIKIDAKQKVDVSFAASDDYFRWNSRIEKTDSINLLAIDNPKYLETWKILASPQWNIAINGVPIVTPNNILDNLDDYFIHTYKPRPNESLTININRPKPSKGKIVSIESIENSYTIGKRSTKTKTTIKYRATQGGNFQIHLHKKATINTVSYDGVNSNLSTSDGIIAVSFLPGTHNVVINWQLNETLDFSQKTPFISLDNDYSNIKQTVNIPRSRWILYGKSQGVGPAFSYWGEFLFFTVLAFFLSRAPYSLLKFWQWLVLGWAFGTVSWFAFAVIVAWLFFISWKNQLKLQDVNYKTILLQWATVFFTLSTLLVFIGSVAYGLLSYPSMGIAGKGSSVNSLHWFLDSYQGEIPPVSIISLPIWWYKAIMLIWSIWVSFSLLNWLKTTIKGMRKDLWWKKLKKQVT